ncbi:MAG: DUF3631 domain-containing protein [Alphaproteobacteria bacterium]
MKQLAAESITDEEVFGEKSTSEKVDVMTNLQKEEEIKRLAGLTSTQYAIERKHAAKRMDMPAAVLDKAIKGERAEDDNKGQGRPLELPDIEPWPEYVEGSALLDEVVEIIGRYIVMDKHEIYATALWAIHTHCYKAFFVTPRLAITSPVRECGKTVLLDVLHALVCRPMMTANLTAAALFRVIEQGYPTILFDEAESLRDEEDERRSLLNSGYRRDGYATRCIGEKNEVRQFSTFAPVAIAQIGQLPDTLQSRSIVIKMRRKRQDEQVEQIRAGQTTNLMRVARKIARWTRDCYSALEVATPETSGLFNRDADNWHALFAIADMARGDIDTQAREAAQALLIKDNGAGAFKEQLLADIKGIISEITDDTIASSWLAKELVGLEDRPWGECNRGKQITAAWLSRRLESFGIRSNTIRTSIGTAKGYRREHFNDAFSRFLPENKNVTIE